MTAEVIRYSDPGAFQRDVGPYLNERPAHNVLLLANIAAAARSGAVDDDCYMAAVVEEEKIIGVAFMDPPRHLMLTGRSQTPLEALAHDLADWPTTVPAVLGPGVAAHFFAVRYAELSAADHFPGMQQHLLALKEVRDVARAAGTLRPATPRDVATVASWFVDAGFELKGRATSREQARRSVEQLVENGTLFLWDDGGPAAMAAVQPQTEAITMVDLVFTPPGRRGRGYGTACVAAVCRQLLAGPARLVILFSGPGDPVANHVYAKIGFRHVTDYHEYHIDEKLSM
jgi:GNAT superfamily N-acetyltransferase